MDPQHKAAEIQDTLQRIHTHLEWRVLFVDAAEGAAYGRPNAYLCVTVRRHGSGEEKEVWFRWSGSAEVSVAEIAEDVWTVVDSQAWFP